MKPSDKIIIICLFVSVIITLSGFFGYASRNSVIKGVEINGADYPNYSNMLWAVSAPELREIIPEVVQDEQIESAVPGGSDLETGVEVVQVEQKDEITEDFYADPNALGTPDGWPDWLATPGITSDTVYIDNEPPDTPSDSEQLARIEYHLSVISGGVILAVCAWFFWLTVVKPLKAFMYF